MKVDITAKDKVTTAEKVTAAASELDAAVKIYNEAKQDGAKEEVTE
ncbi:MAG: hypothetical protein N4A40_13825 [Tissierellales bacterium]|jgi:hypothetical protein|nr:hypothetical protein [Tissierellales bacterium]